MKEYLGDGVYVDFDGFALQLTTEDGVSVTNTVVLEPEVWSSLKTYAEQYEHPSQERLIYHAEGRALHLFVSEGIERHLKKCASCKEVVDAHVGWVERLPSNQPPNKKGT